MDGGCMPLLTRHCLFKEIVLSDVCLKYFHVTYIQLYMACMSLLSGLTRNGKSHLILVLSLFDKVFADFEFGLHESVDEKVGISSDQFGGFRDFFHTLRLGLLFTTLQE